MDPAQLVAPDGSWVHREVYFDHEVYEAERRRLFQTCWLYVAHESQLRSPGDFVASYMGEEPVVVTRDADGQVHVLVNSCTHRGTKICRYQQGNARTFTCSYHGWQFRNDGRLLGVPYSGTYSAALDKDALGLHRAAKVDQSCGMIFATFDPEAPSLADYLGPDLIWYLETVLARGDHGVRMLGGMHRWRINCNWKVPVENHAPDMVHVAPSHRAALSAMGTDDFVVSGGVQVTTQQGHLVAVRYVDDDDVDGRLPGHGMAAMANSGPFLRSLQPSAEEGLGPTRSRINPLSVTIFPNLSLVPTNFTIRVNHPRGPSATEMWSWCFVPDTAPASVEAEILAVYETMLGPGGFLEAEDGENWSAMTDGVRAGRTDPRPLQLKMGLGEEYLHPDLAGSCGPLWSEHNQRGFYAEWRRRLEG